ncbi:chromosome transmission fidelity protein 18 homolog [Babylonia areolata]|uniref:chromosome transmission fidelity protein 18 homolog n=1 Tax=Babylonia areolata TaxID=304850 RepID=UPI003FCF0D58
MDEDPFDLEYADELEAMEDFGMDEGPEVVPKSRRSLQFTTPKSKTNESVASRQDKLPLEEQDLNVSSLSGALNASPEGLNNTILSDDEVDGLAEEADHIVLGTNNSVKDRQTQKKRPVPETDLLDTEVDDFFDSLPDLEPVPKRARHADQRETTWGSHSHSERDADRRRVFRSLPGGDFVPATSSDGQRVYLKLRDKSDVEQEIDNISHHVRSVSSLLPIPIGVMREQLEDERHQQLMEEAKELSQRVQRYTLLPVSCVSVSQDSDSGETLHPQVLWVEQYAPRRYTDLLSEEAINRMLLHWLKQWDYVVFDKDLPLVKNKQKGNKAKEAANNTKWKKFQPEVSMELDDFKRPVQKVALLCGPPGLGKTTLAHIVAKHAGYNVVEMNASDDRSVEAFTNKIEAATQMRAVMGADPRPNCLVIDEIDGAPQAAVNVLLNILKRPEGGGGGGGGRKKKKEGDMLLRPVICICNDLYAPALRQLRQQALVMTFPPTEPSRLASRLSEVVRQEQLKADLNTLLALCERTDNDIRSCLNTLQFIRQRQKELSLRMVQTMSIGQKDSHKSLFSVWREIFTMPRPKRNRFISIYDLTEGKADSLQLNASSPTARFQHILSLAQATGEYERVIQGLYENYLQAKAKDPHLKGLNLSTEWLCFVDGISQHTLHRQDYSLMKYVPFLPVVFHLVYAAFVPPRITFPHIQFEVQQTLTKVSNLVTSLLTDMTPAVRKFVNMRTLTLDLLPPLLDILQPTLRPVNTQLYSSREKEELNHLVRVMINYNMTYRQERSPEGQYVYVLDPNVEEVVRFSGLKQHKQLTYGAKQLIAREIEVEKMRRNEASHFPVSAPAVSKPEGPAIPNHKQTLEARPVKEDKPRTNYFAGFTRTKRQKITVNAENEKEKEEVVEVKNVLDTVIWFHFKEGYSNAVRRNVKMQDVM